jgi:flavodoxin
MKKLVVFYSFEGNTKLIAKHIAQEIAADLLELKPQNESTPKGVLKYLWGGKQVIMKEKPQLVPFDKDPCNYDIIFIGTPVWAWSYAPTLNTFFITTSLSNKKIALFCCHAGHKGQVFSKMRKVLTGNQILSEIDFVNPLKYNKDSSIQKAKEWARNLMSSY